LIDLFVVRTIRLKLLYGLVILHHGRGGLVTVSVTPHPTAEWIAGQVTEWRAPVWQRARKEDPGTSAVTTTASICPPRPHHLQRFRTDLPDHRGDDDALISLAAQLAHDTHHSNRWWRTYCPVLLGVGELHNFCICDPTYPVQRAASSTESAAALSQRPALSCSLFAIASSAIAR
jgi:hypothetical protein